MTRIEYVENGLLGFIQEDGRAIDRVRIEVLAVKNDKYCTLSFGVKVADDTYVKMQVDVDPIKNILEWVIRDGRNE